MAYVLSPWSHGDKYQRCPRDNCGRGEAFWAGETVNLVQRECFVKFLPFGTLHDVILLSGFHLGENEHVHMFTIFIYGELIHTHLDNLWQSWTVWTIWTVVGNPNQCQSPGSCEASMTTPSHSASWEDGNSRLGHAWFLGGASDVQCRCLVDFWLTQPKSNSPISPTQGWAKVFFPAFQVWPACKMQEVIVSC